MCEARRKEKPRELAKKKMQAVTDEMCEPEPATAVNDFKIGHKAAARDGLNRVQQEIATRKTEQEAKLELENERTQEQLNAFEASEAEETKAPSSLSMILNVTSGKTFGMVPQGIKIQSVISEEVRGRRGHSDTHLGRSHRQTQRGLPLHVENRLEMQTIEM